jgi:hypothetical protein
MGSEHAERVHLATYLTERRDHLILSRLHRLEQPGLDLSNDPSIFLGYEADPRSARGCEITVQPFGDASSSGTRNLIGSSAT